MARITSEKAAKKIECLYKMIIIAAARTRELKKGYSPKILTENKEIITAIKEIEEGLIGREYLKKIGNSVQRKSKKYKNIKDYKLKDLFL
jgi:DNA-directed RNA polymerase omega subunit